MTYSHKYACCMLLGGSTDPTYILYRKSTMSSRPPSHPAAKGSLTVLLLPLSMGILSIPLPPPPVVKGSLLPELLGQEKMRKQKTGRGGAAWVPVSRAFIRDLQSRQANLFHTDENFQFFPISCLHSSRLSQSIPAFLGLLSSESYWVWSSQTTHQ